jgi:hypothetical protein
MVGQCVSGAASPRFTVEQIDQVFAAASKQKSWDHFTKPQRKNIETWRKQLQVTHTGSCLSRLH